MGVIGTAGHVDHGKTTLIRALTGIDPDRLKEEKAREMTIDLGFAWLNLPGLAPIGIIDVPGHRDFIENMLAGVGGIDAALFVVAADEGVMPQTREHLAIIDLLGIPTGLVALTKIDLAPDADWIDLVQLDLAEALRGTALAEAPMVRLSARTGEGIDTLREHIVALMTHLPPARDIGRPRLWVDRVFSVTGYGTVVTGTLLDGPLSIGQVVELLPEKRLGRIRGLQSHHQSLEIAQPGSRIAVNVSGVEKSEVRRGHLLVLPDTAAVTTIAAARLRHLPDAPRPLKHNAEVKCFVGAAETIARVRLLENDTLPPGAEGWIQLELRDPLPLFRGDRFILRYPSPGETLGGGVVVDPAPMQRLRRNRSEVITRLEALATGDPAQLVINTLAAAHTRDGLISAIGLTDAEIDAAIDALNAEGRIIQLGEAWIATSAVEAALARVVEAVAEAHKNTPLQPGLKPEKLRSLLALHPAQLDAEALIAKALAEGRLVRAGANEALALPDHQPAWTKTQRAAIDRLRAAFEAAPYTPPSYKEAAAIAGDEVLEALIAWGDLVQVSPEVVFAPTAWRELVTVIRSILETSGRTSVKDVRDRFNTSRKYALAALEYLNSLGITRRIGDDHGLASGDWSRALR